jgi:hypothetical protein
MTTANSWGLGALLSLTSANYYHDVEQNGSQGSTKPIQTITGIGIQHQNLRTQGAQETIVGFCLPRQDVRSLSVDY